MGFLEQKRFLIRHLGNMGDMVFLVPPALETLKKIYPDCHITFVTAWGFKKRKKALPFLKKKEYWGDRNQGGFSIHLMMTNPHIDQLVHWHDTALALNGSICKEDGSSFPTWNREYYEQQKKSGIFDGVYELDFGIGFENNPIRRMYEVMSLQEEDFSNYKLYLTDRNRKIGKMIMNHLPSPRIVLLEGIEGTTTRGWDPDKIPYLEAAIKESFGVRPIWFGSKYAPPANGRSLSLRENIATLTSCDVAIGVMSGPIHFAAAVDLPTITLYGDQPLHRSAPAYFLNPYIHNTRRLHRTILGPTNYSNIKFLKEGTTAVNLTSYELRSQDYKDWQHPGRQDTKSCLSAITVDEVISVLNDSLNM